MVRIIFLCVYIIGQFACQVTAQSRFPLKGFPFLQGLPGISGAIDVQSNGKYIIGGSFSRIDSFRVHNLTRLKSDGSFDNSFNHESLGYSYIGDLLVDKNDRIIIGGSHAQQKYIQRLNPDGTIDSSFNVVDPYPILTIDTLANNKYIVKWQAYGTDKILVKLNEDGSLDPTFNIGSGPDLLGGGGKGITVLKNGQIIVYGAFTQFNGQATSGIVKLNSDGSLDNSFLANGGPVFSANINVGKVIELADGKVLIAGSFNQYNGASSYGLVRLNADGSLDPGFTPYGGLSTLLGSQVDDMVVFPDGAIAVTSLIGGDGIYRVVFLNPDGTLKIDAPPIVSTAFTANGMYNYPHMKIVSDTELFLSGTFGKIDTVGTIGFGRIKNFVADHSFKHGISGDPQILDVELLPDDSYLIVGKFLAADHISTEQLVYINANGSVNQEFTKNLGTAFDHSIYTVESLENGKIMVGGIFRNFDGNAVNGLVRLNQDGSYDSTFSSNINSWSVGPGVKRIVGLAANKVLIYGDFHKIGSLVTGGIARLHENGSYDSSWNLTFAEGTSVTDVEFLNNGNYLMSGITDGNSFLLTTDSDGSIDSSFTTTADLTGYGIIDVSVDTQGNIYASGHHTSWNERPYVIQMDSLGVLVDNMAITATSGYSINKVIPYKNDLIIGGQFNDVNNIARTGIAKVSKNGNLDDAFELLLGVVGTNTPAASGMHLIGDSLLFYGFFGSVDGHLASGYSMVDMMALTPPNKLIGEFDNSKGIVISWNDRSTTEEGHKLYRNTNGGAFVVLADLGPNVISYTDTEIYPDSIYTYKIVVYGNGKTSDFSETFNFTVPYIPVEVPQIQSIVSANNNIQISWTINTTNALGVELYRAVGSTGEYIFIDSLASDITSFIDTEVTAGIEYFYKVRAYNLFEYSDFSIIESSIITAVDYSVLSYQTFYPNPTTGLIYVDINDKSNLRLLDIRGRVLLYYVGNNKTSLDLSSFKPGIYFLQVESGQRVRTMKIIKK